MKNNDESCGQCVPGIPKNKKGIPYVRDSMNVSKG